MSNVLEVRRQPEQVEVPDRVGKEARQTKPPYRPQGNQPPQVHALLSFGAAQRRLPEAVSQ
jgi:hypothetical protein